MYAHMHTRARTTGIDSNTLVILQGRMLLEHCCQRSASCRLAQQVYLIFTGIFCLKSCQSLPVAKQAKRVKFLLVVTCHAILP